MNQEIIPVEAIQERDIDLLLLEELSTNDLFCAWFIEELGLPQLDQLNGVWRSVSDFGLGETDILVSYNSEIEKIYILIENKLDASFQDQQYQRYEERSKLYISNKHCLNSFVVLVAPGNYCINQDDFQLSLSYEKIADWFLNSKSKRGLFKRTLLQIGIEKLRRGYSPVNSPTVQKFWLNYWRYKEENFPSLLMKKPGVVPMNSDWPLLYDERINGVVFYHKLAKGYTDATFEGFSNEIALRIKENIPNWARLEKHKRSFSIRVSTRKIDRTKDFYNQVDLVEEGLRNIERLRDWVLESLLEKNE